MRKLWLVVALVAWGGLAVNTFADVQNIRLSGDIRIRAYYLDGAGLDTGSTQGTDATFISQRTRVSVEADLEDHVLVVVTLAAEGLWGQSDEPLRSSGDGSQMWGKAINRRFDVGVDEAYVQFSELFYTPAALKLGRQYLNYGRGLIISSAEGEYNFDAARLVLDCYPLTIDLVGAELVNNQTFSPTASHLGSSDLLFVNARYEVSDSAIKDVEAYFGWASQGAEKIQNSRVPPIGHGVLPIPIPVGNAANSPLIIGLRGDINPIANLQTWFEGAYEFGANGPTRDGSLSAFLLNVGGRYTLKNVQWTPVLNANYIYASGGGHDRHNEFVPWFDYVDGYNGYLFAPELSNIHIFNLGASVKPYENITLSLQGYYYMKANKDGWAESNMNTDFGGTDWSWRAGASNSRDLGWEIDAILGYDYSKDVRMQLVYGAFLPANAYESTGIKGAAQEVRAEINVKF